MTTSFYLLYDMLLSTHRQSVISEFWPGILRSCIYHLVAVGRAFSVLHFSPHCSFSGRVFSVDPVNNYSKRSVNNSAHLLAVTTPSFHTVAFNNARWHL